VDTTKLSRSAIETVRAVQAALVALAGVVPATAHYVPSLNETAEAVVGAVGPVLAVVAVILQFGVVKKNVTPSSDPRMDDGTPLTPPGQ